MSETLMYDMMESLIMIKHKDVFIVGLCQQHR